MLNRDRMESDRPINYWASQTDGKQDSRGDKLFICSCFGSKLYSTVIPFHWPMSCYYHLIIPKNNDWYLVVGFKQRQKEMVELNCLLLTAVPLCGLSQTSDKEWMERKALPKRVQKSKHSVNTLENRCGVTTTGREKKGDDLRTLVHQRYFAGRTTDLAFLWDGTLGRWLIRPQKARVHVMFALCRGQGRAPNGTPASCQGLSAEASALLVMWALKLRRPIKGRPTRCFLVGSPPRLSRGLALQGEMVSALLLRVRRGG